MVIYLSSLLQIIIIRSFLCSIVSDIYNNGFIFFVVFFFGVVVFLYSHSSLVLQRLTFPFPFVHHQSHDWQEGFRKVEQLLTVETRTHVDPHINSQSLYVSLSFLLLELF